MEMMMDLRKGDCLEVMKGIETGSIDSIITDPPYGTTSCKWDSVIDFELMWEQLNRIIKPNGAIVLFGQEPFSSLLRTSNLKLYKYDIKWHKDKCSNFIHAKTQPRKTIEDVIVFSKGGTTHNSKIKYTYNSQKTKRKARSQMPKTQKSKNQKEIRRDNTNLFYGDGFEKDKSYAESYVYFATDHLKRVHPTQKPVLLMEYLIKTYTNEGETVLDFTMGSGSTGVACVNTNRNFIGIEMDAKYFDIATERIANVPCLLKL
jgi:site-specific DNA-methyltransferase (adenine-specific)